MAGRGLFSFLSLILVSAGQMFGLFILLGGAIDHRPISNFYFLQADTTNIPNAPQLARWTFWNICEGASGHNVCSGSGYGSISPARPLDPPSTSNFGTTENVPAPFIGTNFYYLMTRCMFAFTLIALFFGGCAMLTGVLALCTRLGAKLSGFLTTLAFIMQGVAAGLMTGAFVKGRDHFRSNGQNADIGTYAFGFMWAAFACFFVSTVLFCMGGKGKKSSSTKGTPESPAAGTFFKGGRSTSTRSRGSFINGDNKEYV